MTEPKRNGRRLATATVLPGGICRCDMCDEIMLEDERHWHNAPEQSTGGTDLPADLTDYQRGYLHGLAAYAWWKDGTQWVGTCGTRLAVAEKRFLKEKR